MPRQWIYGFALVLGLIIACAAVLLLRMRTPDLGDTGDTAAGPQTPARETRQSTPADPPVKLERATSQPSPSTEPEPPPAKPDPLAILADRIVGTQIHGRVIVIDPDGVEHKTESGTIRFVVPIEESGHRGGSIEIAEVVDGAWTFVLRQGSVLRVDEIRLGGRRALHDHGDADIEVTPDEEWVIRAGWPAGTLLHVTDARTGEPLDEVRIVKIGDRGFIAAAHPGPEPVDALMTGVASPVELPPAEAYHAGYLVGAHGYAWRAVQLDERGGERTIALEPGGTLRVDLEHDRRPAGAHLRLYAYRDPEGFKQSILDDARQSIEQARMDGTLDEAINQVEQLRDSLPPEERGFLDIYDSLLRGEEPDIDAVVGFTTDQSTGDMIHETKVGDRRRIEFDALPIGPYVVRVEIGKWYASPLVLDRARVDVPATGIGLATLAWSEPETPEMSTLRGTIRYARSWDDCPPGASFEERHVELRFLGTSTTGTDSHRFVKLQPPHGDGDIVRRDWDAGEVEPGRYVVALNGYCKPEYIDLAAGEDHHSEIELEPPARVRVRTVDASSGEAVEIRNLSWSVGSTWMTGGMKHETLTSGSGEIEFCAPVGSITLMIWGDEAHDANEIFEITAGLNELTLEVTAVYTVTIELIDGTTVVPNPDAWLERTEVLEGTGILVSQSSGPSIEVAVSAPGLYRFTLPQVPGYKPVPPQEVRVGPDRATTHRVMLEPLR